MPPRLASLTAPLSALLFTLTACSTPPSGAGGDTSVLLSAPSDVYTPAYSVARPADLPDDIVLQLTRRGGYLFVPAFINGEPVGPMLVDTGATLGVVAQGVAGRLRLPVVDRGQTVGVGGIEPFDFHRVDRLALGNPDDPDGFLGLASQRMAGLNLAAVGGAVGSGTAGIVAYTDFGPCPFTIDHAAATLTVHRPDTFTPPRDATVHRLERYRSLPLVRAAVAGRDARHDVWLILDYGADAPLTLPVSLLYRDPSVRAVAAHGTGRTGGIGGTVSSTQTWLRRLGFLGLDLEQLPANFEEPPPTMRDPNRPVGRVGNSLLQHFILTFDPPHGRIYAKWIPGRTP